MLSGGSNTTLLGRTLQPNICLIALLTHSTFIPGPVGENHGWLQSSSLRGRLWSPAALGSVVGESYAYSSTTSRTPLVLYSSTQIPASIPVHPRCLLWIICQHIFTCDDKQNRSMLMFCLLYLTNIVNVLLQIIVVNAKFQVV